MTEVWELQEMLHRLVYMSVATRDLTEDDVAQILSTSRKNNAAAYLSGLLIYHDRRFFQVIEGPPDPLQSTARRIAKDRRHATINVIFDGPVKHRAFPTWTMGYAKTNDLPEHLRDFVFSIYNLVPPNSESRGDDPLVREAIRGFLGGFERFGADARIARGA